MSCSSGQSQAPIRAGRSLFHGRREGWHKGCVLGRARRCALGKPTLILPGLRPATEARSLHNSYRLLVIRTSGCTWGAFPEARVLACRHSHMGCLPCLKCITCGLVSNPAIPVREEPEAPVTPPALSCLSVSHLMLPVELTAISAGCLSGQRPLATFLGWGTSETQAPIAPRTGCPRTLPPGGWCGTHPHSALCSSLLPSQGVRNFSVPVGLDSSVRVDLVVVGSVAVSEKGKLEACVEACLWLELANINLQQTDGE